MIDKNKWNFKQNKKQIIGFLEMFVPIVKMIKNPILNELFDH